jgi:hypothetical protein
MASSELTASNSERIDKLMTAATELQATVRLHVMLSYVVFPLLIGLLAFLAVTSFYNMSRIDRLTDKVTELDELVLKLDRNAEPALPAPPSP